MASENTEVNQLNALIDIKKEEIKELEERRSDEEARDLQTPAEVAADPSADADARAAAASATASQDPAAVFAAQSQPSPSTHAEQFADEEGEQRAEEDAEEAEKNENDGAPAGNQGVEIPSGRGDVNKLGDPATQGYGTDAESEAANAADAGDEAAQDQQEKKADEDDSAENEDAKNKAAETRQNEGSVATTGETGDDDKKPQNVDQKDSEKN